MDNQLDLPELPLKSLPVDLDETGAYPVVVNNGEVAGVFRLLPESYDCMDNWDGSVLQQKLLNELSDFNIPMVWFAPFVAKDFQQRSRIAVIAQYVPGVTLDEAFSSDPDKARPQIDLVVSSVLDYYEHKFKTGERYLFDISRFDQYKFTPDGPVLIDIDGLASFTIEDIRETEDENSEELSEYERVYAKEGNAGVGRLGIVGEFRFLEMFYKDKVSPEVYERCVEAKEMADGYIEDVLAAKA